MEKGGTKKLIKYSLQLIQTKFKETKLGLVQGNRKFEILAYLLLNLY